MKHIHTRVRARDIHEHDRASTPLELLFDLTFVVAIGSLVAQLAHAVAEGRTAETIAPFVMVFFAIWWAWNQFTWLASAYDTDDVLYRLCVLVQMGGVLVLAAGVPAAFEHQDFAAITLGYFIMRLGLLGIILRAMRDDPETRGTSRRYFVGISVVQVGWLLAVIFNPGEFLVVVFVVLAAGELAVAPWADRAGDLHWHPHHIAERYGLFTIILLGESVLAATLAIQVAVADGVTVELVAVGVCGLVLLFTLWWLYFSEPAGEGLEARRGRSYLWGYGHYFVFASLAATGAGLEIAVEAVGHHGEATPLTVGYALAIPVALFLILLWLLYAPLLDHHVIHPAATVVASVLVLLVPLEAPVVGAVGTTLGITVVCVGLLAVTIRRWSRMRAGVTTG